MFIIWSSGGNPIVTLGMRIVIGALLGVVGYLGTMAISRVSPRLGLWVAAIGFFRCLAIVLVALLEAAFVVMMFAVEASDRMVYAIIAVVWGIVMTFTVRKAVREARKEMDAAETGTGPGQPIT